MATNSLTSQSRRSFVIGTTIAGGGLTLGLSIQFGSKFSHAADIPREVNAWVVIQPDETVIIRIARTEMGQGTLTGLAQMVAEELECDWSKVTTEYPTPGQSVARKRVWGAFGTGGSRGIRDSQEYVRRGGATARVMLVQAAANEWKVPAGECTVSNGVITHAPSGRTTTYGRVARAAASVVPPKDVALKDPKTWKLIGQPVKRLDTIEKLTGKAIYGIDVRLPGMLYATIKECPVFGGKLKSFDASKVSGMKGVKIILAVNKTAVAVVADTWWQAVSAMEVLPIVWDEGESAKVSSASIAEILKAGLDAEQAFIGNSAGDTKGALRGAKTKLEAVYSFPYLSHAAMEPMNATAIYTPDRCEVWCGTQNGEAALAAVVAASGLPFEKCEVHKMSLGGAFGRSAFDQDFVRQAVHIAKQIPGVPVKMLWTREEDMTQGRYHPVTQCKLVGGFDADKNLHGLHVRIAAPSILASAAPMNLQDGKDPSQFYGLNQSGDSEFGYAAIPNILIDHAMRNMHVPPRPWRGVSCNQNAISVECFMDELAHEVGQDPLEFRRKLMSKNPKHLAVLNAVAERVGWGKAAPKGVFRGLAQMKAFASYVAACAEVSVDGNKVKIHRIVCATDCGYAVNPSLIERQIEGAFVFGLSALFYQENTVKNGRVEPDNFDNFPSMHIAQMPKVESIIMPSGGFWGGVGEPTICVGAPAVLNAMAAAMGGKRIRSFPLKNHGFTLV